MRGQYIFLNFCEFQTLYLQVHPYYSPVSTTGLQNIAPYQLLGSFCAPVSATAQGYDSLTLMFGFFLIQSPSHPWHPSPNRQPDILNEVDCCISNHHFWFILIRLPCSGHRGHNYSPVSIAWATLYRPVADIGLFRIQGYRTAQCTHCALVIALLCTALLHMRANQNQTG